MSDTEGNTGEPIGSTSDATDVQIEYVIVHKKRSPLQRFGCVIAAIAMLIISALPVLLVVLAIQGSITVSYGDDVPDAHEHPRFQLSLISEIDFRGFQFTRSSRDTRRPLTLHSCAR